MMRLLGVEGRGLGTQARMIWNFRFQNCKSTIKCRKMSRLLVYTARTIVVWGNVPTLSKSHFPLSKVQLPENKKEERKKGGR